MTFCFFSRRGLIVLDPELHRERRVRDDRRTDAPQNVFPPIPSEVVTPVAGIAAGRGDLNMALVIVFGTTGAVAGQLLWYWLGLRIGEEGPKRLSRRHGRWFTVSPRDIERADDWFDEHGARAVLIARMVPGGRSHEAS